MYLLESYQALKGRCGLAFGAFIIHALFAIALGSLPGGPLLSLFIIAPIEIGYLLLFLTIARGEDCSIGALFGRFVTGKLYWQAIRAKLLLLIRVSLPVLISLLGCLLLFAFADVRPAHSKFSHVYPEAILILLVGLCWSCYLTYTYRFAFYVLKDLGEGARVRDALQQSKNLSRGYIWKLMLLDAINFAGLAIVFIPLYIIQLILGVNPVGACVASGIASFLVFPLVFAIFQIATAYLYLEAKRKLSRDAKWVNESEA